MPVRIGVDHGDLVASLREGVGNADDPRRFPDAPPSDCTR